MGIDRYTSYVKRALRKNNSLYRRELKKSLGDVVDIDFEKARSLLQVINPYVKPCLPSSRAHWPTEPSVDASVIVPCYKVEEFVESCLDSILGQATKYTYEVIAVDDGSPDSTGSILDRLAADAPQMRVIHQENRGFSGARNRALEEIRGGGCPFCRL